MTKFNLLIVMFFCASINAQKKLDILIPFDDVSKKYTYSEVVESKWKVDDLYKKAKKWATNTYQDDTFKIDEGNKLVTQGTFEILYTMKAGMGIKMPMKYTINFDIILEFKEDRYRYTFTNIFLSQNQSGTTAETSIESYVESYNSMGIGKRKLGQMIEELCAEIHQQFIELIPKLKTSMLDNNIKDDW